MRETLQTRERVLPAAPTEALTASPQAGRLPGCEVESVIALEVGAAARKQNLKQSNLGRNLPHSNKAIFTTQQL